MTDKSKRKVLETTAAVLLAPVGWILRVVYRLFYGWGRYREFVLWQVKLEAVLSGVGRTEMSPTRETDARIREIDEAIRAGSITYSEKLDGSMVLPAGEALDRLAKEAGLEIK